MTYQELLRTSEWRLKRKGIVLRDELCCVNCGNQDPLENVHCSLFKRTSTGKSPDKECYSLLGSPWKHFFISRNEARWPGASPPSHLVVYHEPILEYSIGELLKMNEEEQNNTRVVFPLAIRELEISEYQENSNGIRLVRNMRGVSGKHHWILNHTLQVHHKYYQIKRRPWEYPDEALITLCYLCHQKVHETTKIRLIDSFNNHVRFLNNCWACNGTGERPEYHYYMQGICFSCGGSGFTDLE